MKLSARSTAGLVAVLIASGPLLLAGVGPLDPELREKFSIDEHYQQVLLVEGFPIVASERVHQAALEEAAHNVRSMLSGRPDILRQLARNKIRLGIMAISERTCDLPEHADLEPEDYWNRRARGLGASRRRPCVSCGEENLLHNPGDQYPTESIMIHEFAHAIHHMALNDLDPTFDQRLRAAYDSAMKGDLWKDLYAAENHSEYWAEAVQTWFDTNRENDAIHNHVDTREELIEYDPALAKLCREVFGENKWRYVRSDDPSRRGEPHLKDLDRSSLAPFRWSEKEEKAFAAAGKLMEQRRERDR